MLAPDAQVVVRKLLLIRRIMPVSVLIISSRDSGLWILPDIAAKWKINYIAVYQ